MRHQEFKRAPTQVGAFFSFSVARTAPSWGPEKCDRVTPHRTINLATRPRGASSLTDCREHSDATPGTSQSDEPRHALRYKTPEPKTPEPLRTRTPRPACLKSGYKYRADDHHCDPQRETAKIWVGQTRKLATAGPICPGLGPYAQKPYAHDTATLRSYDRIGPPIPI
jgi:hypothetical protein